MRTYVHTPMGPDQLRYLADQLEQMNPAASGSLITEVGTVWVSPGQTVSLVTKADEVPD